MRLKDAIEESYAHFNTSDTQLPTSGVPYAEALDTQPWNVPDEGEEMIPLDIKHGTGTEHRIA